MERQGYRLFPGILGVAIAAAAPAIGLAASAPVQKATAVATAAKQPLRLLPVQGNVYLIAGLEANVTVQVGSDGLLFVDTPPMNRVDEAVQLVQNVAMWPVSYVITTHLDAEHVGGSEALTTKGARLDTFFTTGSIGPAPVAAGGATTGVTVLGHESVLNRLSAAGPAQFPGATITAEYFMPSKDFFMNGDPIVVYHAPAAHTDGDSFVYFRRSDVISVGDLFSPGRYPDIDIDRGGSIDGLIDAINRILAITVPAAFQEAGTYLVPGHGRLCDEADLSEYREMLTVIRDRVRDMIGQGMTLPQTLAARPSLDYDVTNNDMGGPSGQAFVEDIYQSLMASAKGADK